MGSGRAGHSLGGRIWPPQTQLGPQRLLRVTTYPAAGREREGQQNPPPMHLPELILSPLHTQTLSSSPSSSLFSTEL